MKTLFALWFALCLSVGAALPAPAWLAATVTPSGGGTPVKKDEQTRNDDYYWFGATYKDGAGAWIAGSSYSLTSVKVQLHKHSTATAGTVTAYIYNANPGTGWPTNAPISVASSVKNNADLVADPGQLEEFTFSTPVTIVNGNTYCIAMFDSLFDSTGQFALHVGNAAGYSFAGSLDDSVWSERAANLKLRFETWGY